MSGIKLSVLDQSPVRKGGTAAQALLETTELAKFTEKLGYTRFWVSEHHNTASLAGSSPEVLIAHLANQTNRIKLGSGGVMLPNHSALKVAENFRLLETLFPGRIDLGMGRAPGTDRYTASLLNPSNTFNENDFTQQLVDLTHYLNDGITGPNLTKIKAAPLAQTVPELWLLSSSGQSGVFAAHFGMGFSFAHFINPNGGAKMMKLYREHFQPSEHLKEPKANVAIFVMVADTEEKAQQLQAVMDVQMLKIEKGVREGILPYEEIKDQQFTEEEKERIDYNRKRMISGTPAQVKPRLEKLAQEYGIDEIIAVTITHDFADRLRSYELLAEMFELQPQEV
ncbi:LLM class flavin-dependent oxidoreductase [Adhaeribacter terreus]|uniref:LLM class flavin-dependent oxidoreductase n=1 Tax=Adhaeribacter terreus TaxID=529703 RepID=A0ABW0E8E7_9BACT